MLGIAGAGRYRTTLRELNFGKIGVKKVAMTSIDRRCTLKMKYFESFELPPLYEVTNTMNGSQKKHLFYKQKFLK
jgi:hypothetical protein